MMNKLNSVRLFIILLIIFTVKSAFCATNKINLIKIEGTERIEEDTVRNYLSFEENQEIDQNKIDQSLKSLYATGLFSNISITENNRDIIIKIVENPIINKIIFEGNKHIKSDELLSSIILKPRSNYSKFKLQHDVNKINDIYNKSGRFSVKLTPKIVELNQNRIDLIFVIDEGKKAPVSKIFFIGNKNFKDSKLASIINTKEHRWYRFFSNADNFDQLKIEYDKELLRKFYNSSGFPDLKIISSISEISKNKDEFIITFLIDEGEKYKYGKIDIENNLPDESINSASFKKSIITKENQIYNSDDIEDTIDNLTKEINDMGIAFVNIDSVFNQHEDSKTIDIKYVIDRGKELYLNRINITGNIKTLDKVIRREFRIAESDPYNASQISRSEQRIKNLDFFDKVKITNSKTDFKDKYDVNVDVKEKSTSKINIGGGYSGTDGVLAQFSFTEDNLLGKGQQVNFGIMKGNKKLDLDLSYTEPYLFDKELSAGIDIYRLSNGRKNINPYKSLTSGITLRTGYAISEHLTHMQRYSYKQDNINDINDNASIYVKEQRGKYSTSSIGQIFFYDKTDSRIDPKSGYSLKLDQEFAGIGGDAKFIRDEVNLRYYKSVINNDIILQLSANVGHITGISGKKIRINERFFIGDVGPYGLRGFAPGGIGPRAFDITAKKRRGDPLGGNIYYTATTSVAFPLGLPEELDVSGSLFTDIGSLYKIDLPKINKEYFSDRSVRASVGAGFIWVTKLGPIRLDFPMPLIYKKYDRKQHFHINFSTNL